jgi:hypothetical protein
MPKIAVGWRIAARVHGLELPTGIYQRIEEVRDRARRYPIDIHFSLAPLQPEIHADVPRFMRAGKVEPFSLPIAAPSSPHPLAPPIAWLTVDALGALEVDEAPYANVDLSGSDADGREHEAAMQMLAALDHRIEMALRPRAELAFGLLAVLLPHGVVEQRLSAPLVVGPRRRAIFRNRLFLSEFIASGAAPADDLVARIRAAVPGIYAPDATAKVLRVAAAWYVKARLEDSVSNARFVFGFLAVEALCSLAKPGMEPIDAERFDALERVAEADSPELLAYVKSLKGRGAGPSLKHRFARLAREYDPDHAGEAIEIFAKCHRVRNDLVHCRITDIPVRGDGKEPHPGHSVMQLARNYLQLITSRIEEAGRSRVVTGPPPRRPDTPPSSSETG